MLADDPAIACLRGRALGHSCFTTKTNGAADGTRTRMNSVDSGVPYLSASTAQMGVSESTRLLLDHPVFRLGAPTTLRTRQSVVCPAITPGPHNGSVSNLVGPPGFEPGSHPSEGCALSS